MSDQPIYDEAVANQNVESDEKGFIPSPENPDEGKVTDNHDAEDVDAALGRETEDGPGFGDESQLPDEDFEGFAEDDVEVTE